MHILLLGVAMLIGRFAYELGETFYESIVIALGVWVATFIPDL
jgi:hypothetical protein